MFKRLRTKLTVLYAGLFCIVLVLISAAAYAVAARQAQSQVRDQLVATGAVFDRLWQVRFAGLQEGAELSVRDYGFRQAVATGDAATVRSALQNLHRRLGADLVVLVPPEGGAINSEEESPLPLSAALKTALENDDALTGVLEVDGVLHQAVTAPVLAPNLLGWVVVGQRLDQEEMRSLEQLSPIPLHAVALSRLDGVWSAPGERLSVRDRGAVSTFINRAMSDRSARPESINVRGGRAVALVRPLRTLDGSRAVLFLSYPLALALANYRSLFEALIAVGVLGLALVAIGTWLLARGITRPISELETAARDLEAGEYAPVRVETSDEIARLALSFNAMIDAIKLRERRITDLALTDSETLLPNRLALERRLKTQDARDRRVFVAAIGIDRFEQVRSAIGYAHANALIARIGERLVHLSSRAPMGRLATDVLGVAFLAGDEGDARRRIAALQAKLEQPLSLDGQVVDIDVSVGVAAVEGEEAHVDRASIALDQARKARVKLAFFDSDSYGDPARNLSLMGEMRRALSRGEIRLAHQPKLDLRARRITGVEALVRWTHPSRGPLPPDLFISMAEETGNIRALTEFVLHQAVEDQSKLAAAGWPLAMSVNISGRLIGDRHFAKHAIEAVRGARHGFCFEITETAVIDNPKLALENIELFAAHSVQISIDDYGSGLSSLAYLKQLPAHELKIDKLFIQHLTDSKRDALLVRSTVDLAHGLGLKVTAEGVEQPACIALLAAMGCDMAQGYLISRPVPVHELLSILEDTHRMDFLGHTALRAGGEAA
ncbi:MAG: EAL domain-containing protein [Hyphomonadaceae bacterium]|nr:EAL domain-containing protein [Hyphomonadaceae bacterium]